MDDLIPPRPPWNYHYGALGFPPSSVPLHGMCESIILELESVPFFTPEVEAKQGEKKFFCTYRPLGELMPGNAQNSFREVGGHEVVDMKVIHGNG